MFRQDRDQALAGRTYAGATRAFLDGDVESERLTALRARDIEQYVWRQG